MNYSKLSTNGLSSRPNWATNSRAANTAIAVGVFRQILLVIRLGVIPSTHIGYLSGDGFVTSSR
jgi:hypothetical protein